MTSNRPFGSFTGILLYWIAVNGSSCARSPGSLRWPFTVMPMPQHLIGFETETQAKFGQMVMLEWPISEVKSQVDRWAARSDVVMIKPDRPECQTDGPTLWSELESEVRP